MRFHLTPIGMAILKKSTSSTPGDVERREPSYTMGGNGNWRSHDGEQHGGASETKDRAIL